MLTNTELYSTYLTCKELSNSNKRLSIRVRNSDTLISQLIDETSFLPESSSISERLYCYVNNISEIPKCPYCGKPKLYKGKMDKGYYSTCGSDECKKRGIIKGARNRTREERISAAKKGQETYYKKTGYYNNMQNPDGYEAWKASFKEKYGETHPLKTKDIKEKVKATTLERHGTLDMLHCEKSINTIIQKYGSINNYYSQISKKSGITKSANAFNIIKSKLSDFNFSYVSNDEQGNFTIKCNVCNSDIICSRQYINYYWRNNIRFCPKCDYKNMTFRSGGEKLLSKSISSFYDGPINYNRYIGGVECDIILPDKKIAIDYNGLYWHSELHKDKLYHINKKKKVEAAGYSLIYVWEDDFNDSIKREIILSRIKSKLGLTTKIYARKCEIKKFESKEEIKNCVNFLNENHLHGYSRAKQYYGLLYNNELVELISIGKIRPLISKNSNEIELIRLCTKNEYTVVGGFSRLIKYAISDLNANELVSYIDLDWSNLDNSSYVKIGFNVISYTGVNYWWSKNGIKENRMKFTKKNLVKLGEDPNKTEYEIMIDRGYYRIFGTGNLKVKYYAEKIQ